MALQCRRMNRICTTLQHHLFEVVYRYVGKVCGLRTVVLRVCLSDYTFASVKFCFEVVQCSIGDFNCSFPVHGSRG